MSTVDIHPSLLLLKIIHFDMDAFYASVEVRDDPSLRGRPVIVGGPPNSRAVVCTASYEARRFGIRSAMPCAQAARLCPGAVFLRPDFAKYSAASEQIRTIFHRYTDLVEPLSLDEAYLDVTDNGAGLFAVQIARRLQEEIHETCLLTGSAGVAPNKLVAKIASEIRKPNGLTVVVPADVLSFMGQLPLRKIHGVGPATERTLAAVGLVSCRDVWALERDTLLERLGKSMGEWLHLRSRGIDERAVTVSRPRKSLGREETFRHDILDITLLKRELSTIAAHVASDLRECQVRGRTITLKVRYGDFTRITRSQSLSDAVDEEATIREVAERLLENTEAGQRQIRLLGISVSSLAAQLTT